MIVFEDGILPSVQRVITAIENASDDAESIIQSFPPSMSVEEATLSLQDDLFGEVLFRCFDSTELFYDPVALETTLFQSYTNVETSIINREGECLATNDDGVTYLTSDFRDEVHRVLFRYDPVTAHELFLMLTSALQSTPSVALARCSMRLEMLWTQLFDINRDLERLNYQLDIEYQQLFR